MKRSEYYNPITNMTNFSESFKKLKLRYRVTIALTLFIIAVVLRFEYIPHDSGGPFVTFYPVIILSFYLCGAFSGALITVLSGIVGTYYFIPPYNQLSINNPIPLSVIFFGLTSTLIGIISAIQHRNIEQLNIILDNEMVGGMMLKNRKIVWCNKAISKILGYSQSEMIGASTKILFQDIVTFEEIGQEAYPLVKGESYRKQFEMRKADGNSIWVDVSGSLISYNVNLSLWLVNDISELKNMEDKLRNQVNYDSLTGLLSREWFMSQSELELNRSKRYDSPASFLMIDIDFFKRINDTYGHQAGDLVLKSFADISRKSMRNFDLYGRLGGEEFSILLPETNLESALQLAERFRLIIEKTEIPLMSDGLVINITVSIGVSSFDCPQDTISALISRADTALYKAKNSGRNQVISLTI